MAGASAGSLRSENSPRPLRIGGLCEGYGGLTMGVQAAVGGELAWYSEIDEAAVAVLEHHHPGVPNHGDLTVADWAGVEPVDIVTAGWPCQPWSLAGRRKGVADERAIWPFVAGAVRVLRPRLVVLENVRAIVRAGELARAVTDLARIGYVGRWLLLRASDVGAPHERARIFVVAWPAADTSNLGHERGRSARGGWDGSADGGDAAPDPDPDPDGDAVRQQPVDVGGRGGAAVAGRAGEAAPDPAGIGVADEPGRCDRAVPLVAEYRPGDRDRVRDVAAGAEQLGRSAGELASWGTYDAAIRRWERVLGRPAPAPTVLTDSGAIGLSAHLDEWLMGLPEGRVTDVPGLRRRQMLRLCGNGVVPLQAETAVRWALNHAADSTSAAA